MRFWLDFIYLAPLWGEARQMWCFWRQMWSGACFPSVEPLQCLAGCQPGSASGGTEEAPVYCVCVCVSKAESVMCICRVCIHVWGTVWNTCDTCDTYQQFNIHPIIIWYQWILKCHNTHRHTHTPVTSSLRCELQKSICGTGQHLRKTPSLCGSSLMWAVIDR